jgi:hypothetical protein
VRSLPQSPGPPQLAVVPPPCALHRSSEAAPRATPQELRIQDFALVTEQTVKFSPGLNAITGESGAGKSVLIEALGQLLGAAAPPECVRAPATTAVIEGTVQLDAAAAARAAALGAELGLPARALPAAGGAESAQLLLRREVGLAARADGAWEGSGAIRSKTRRGGAGRDGAGRGAACRLAGKKAATP